MSTQGLEVEMCYSCTPCNPTNWILIPLCLSSRLFFKLLFDGVFSYIKVLKLLFFQFCFNNSELFNCILLERLQVTHFKGPSEKLQCQYLKFRQNVSINIHSAKYYLKVKLNLSYFLSLGQTEFIKPLNKIIVQANNCTVPQHCKNYHKLILNQLIKIQIFIHYISIQRSTLYQSL